MREHYRLYVSGSQGSSGCPTGRQCSLLKIANECRIPFGCASRGFQNTPQGLRARRGADFFRFGPCSSWCSLHYYAGMTNVNPNWLSFEDPVHYEQFREVLVRANYTVPGTLEVMGFREGGAVSTTD